jgi:hypothetical protein
MNTPHLVEALLAGLVYHDEACDCYPELGELRLRSRTGRPLQWILLADDLPRARGVIRHAAIALLDLLDAIDDGWEAARADDCPLWHGLALAPPWLLRPAAPDDATPDIALLLERDEAYGGDWRALVEALHQAGSRQWQWAIRRCRAMERFEAEQGIALRDLVPSPIPEDGEGVADAASGV